MRNKVMVGIAGGVVAAAVAVGSVFAGTTSAAPASEIVAQATATATAQPGALPQRGERTRNGLVAGALVRTLAEETGLERRAIADELRTGKTLEQVAQENGATSDAIIQAARTNVEERLSQAVADGRIDQARADELLAEFDAVAPQAMTSTELGQQFDRLWQGRGKAALVRTTADVTGLEPREVVEQLRAGKSLEQIAQENGKTADDILAQVQTKTEERQQRLLDRAAELITEPGLGAGEE